MVRIGREDQGRGNAEHPDDPEDQKHDSGCVGQLPDNGQDRRQQDQQPHARLQASLVSVMRLFDIGDKMPIKGLRVHLRGIRHPLSGKSGFRRQPHRWQVASSDGFPALSRGRSRLFRRLLLGALLPARSLFLRFLRLLRGKMPAAGTPPGSEVFLCFLRHHSTPLSCISSSTNSFTPCSGLRRTSPIIRPTAPKISSWPRYFQ